MLQINEQINLQHLLKFVTKFRQLDVLTLQTAIQAHVFPNETPKEDAMFYQLQRRTKILYSKDPQPLEYLCCIHHGLYRNFSIDRGITVRYGTVFTIQYYTKV